MLIPLLPMALSLTIITVYVILAFHCLTAYYPSRNDTAPDRTWAMVMREYHHNMRMWVVYGLALFGALVLISRW